MSIISSKLDSIKLLSILPPKEEDALAPDPFLKDPLLSSKIPDFVFIINTQIKNHNIFDDDKDEFFIKIQCGNIQNPDILIDINNYLNKYPGRTN